MMTKQENQEFFYFAWDSWIVPLSQELFNDMDKNFRLKVNAKIGDLDFIRIKAEEYFFSRYNTFKNDYYGYMDDNQTPDIHKICAILCRTLIEEKIIKYDITVCQKYIEEHIDKHNTDWLVKNALVNYRIAFYASITLLYEGMLFKYKNDKTMHEKLKNNRKLNLYTKSDGSPKSINHESFENYIILDLAKRDVNNKSFEFFMYAALMYQLEEYNRMILENEEKLQN